MAYMLMRGCIRALGVLLFAVPPLCAQASFGTLNGTVSDPTGGVRVRAGVEIVNATTGVEIRTETNGLGYYQFLNLWPGDYSLRVELDGFRTAHVPTVTVGVGQAVTQDVQLELGPISQTIEVAAQSELLQSSTSELGGVVEEVFVNQLPLSGRNFTQLLLLTPGVNPVSTAQGPKTTISLGVTEGNSGLPGSTVANASLHGQQNRSKIYYLDGIVNTSVRASNYVVLPSVDAIQEMSVQSHAAKAEYGGATGGVINISSKSGGNRLRGSVFWLIRNDAFDARDPFRDALRDNPPEFRQNQFGATAGGPIVHNKTFFFASYDGWRYRDVGSAESRVPTTREFSGDFSATPFGRAIYDPFSTRTVSGRLTRDPFPSNRIPPNLIDRQMEGFFEAYMYQPNLAGDPTYNFRQERARHSDADALQVRVDRHFTAGASFFRWNEQRIRALEPVGDLGYRTPDTTNRNVGGGYVHEISPSMILSLRGGLATQPTEDAPLEHPLGLERLRSLGLSNVERFAGATVRLSNNPWLNDTLGVQGARPRGNPNWNVSGDLTAVLGTHTLKAGLQYHNIRRLQKNQLQSITFNQDATRDPQRSGTGDDLASGLLGIPSRVMGLVHETGYLDFGTGTVAGFIQDQWKAAADLTLTFGLRYEYVRKVSGYGLQSGPDMATGEWLIGAEAVPPVCDGRTTPCIPAPLESIPFHDFITITGERNSILRPIKDNWGPRMGVAWRASATTVIRGGYGLVWDSLASRSQYGQHQFVNGWPVAFGYDTGAINRLGDPLQTIGELGELPFATPRPEPWNGGAWLNDPRRKDGYSQQWHVEIQRGLRRDLMASVGYVGSSNGRLEYAGVAAASPIPGVASDGRRLDPQEVNALRPWPHITGSFVYEQSTGTSTYHGLEVKLEKRFGGGLAALVSYTWSKSIDTSSGWFNVEGGVGGSASVQNFHDRNSNRAVSSYDVPHLLTAAAGWEIPLGTGKRHFHTGVVARVLGGWQMNWLVIARSGQPFTVEVGGDRANIGNTQTYVRANIVGDPHAHRPTAEQWFDPGDFAIPDLAFGNSGRNILRTDGVFNADLGLTKRISAGERRHVEIRLEAFNVFNHMDLGEPRTRLDLATPGRVTSISHDPRQLQFGLRFVF